MRDLPCVDQLSYSSRDVLDGHCGIDAVLVEQVDLLDAETTE